MRNFTHLKLFSMTLILCLGLFSTALAQTREVSGVVISGEDNLPLPGASILVKGTTNGTVTDIDGKFSLNVSGPTDVLVLSFIGFTQMEVVVGSKTTFDLTLLPDTKSLEEVIVVGYGEQKKETITGAVSSVKGKELTKSPALNLSNSIAGRMAGVVAVNRSGEPGNDGSSIRIRGSNTLGNNSALIVIDGIPARAGGLDRINPNDIESISVLKDASAAIYGSRAANGVILVTTKRGSVGAPELTFQVNQGWAQPALLPALANSAEYANSLNELDIYALPTSEWAAANAAYKQNGLYTRPNGQVRKAPYSPDEIELYQNGTDQWNYPDTDWYGETLKTWSPQSMYNLQLVGGSEDVKYLTSLGYQDQDGYYKNSATGYKQYDFRINLDANVNKYVKVGIGILAREELRSSPTRSVNAIFRMQMRGKPNQPAYWPNGLPGPDIENGENPVVITTDLSGYGKDKRDYIQTTGTLEIKIPGVEGLKFTGTAAVDKYIQATKTWQIPWTLYQKGSGFEADGVTPVLVPSKRGPAEPNLRESTEQQLNVLLGGVLNYDKKFNDIHSLNIVAGVNRETIEGNNFNAYRRFFISTAIDQMFAGGDLQKDNGGGAFNRARLNYFGRVAYNYKEKYLAEFLWRYDGSYIFPEDTRFGFFPGLMLGWVVSEESFWKNSLGKTFDFFKIRGSWGQLGNDQIAYGGGSLLEYQYLSTYGFNSYIIGGSETKTLFETRVPNEAITWEIANNSNLGFEGQFLQGKMFFEFDLFYNKRTNILWQRNASVPQSTGLNLPAENIGEVENKGFDLNIGIRGGKGEFQYSASVNGGYAKNNILFWDESPGAPEWQMSTGRPMNTGLVYQYDGVFPDQQSIDAETLDYKAITNTLRPGDMKYKDYNGDGKITPDDRVRLDQNTIPTFQGGVNFTANWKGLDLSILVQGAAGARQYISAGESGNIGNFLSDVYDNRWTIDNPSSVDPRLANRNDQYYSSGNDYWFRSSDYLRLKNVEIGYNIPSSITERIGIKNARFYVNGLNLITWSKTKVYDPESDAATGQYYPQARVLNTGLSVSF
ncbi:TonB-linked SusC/RagA family outer membrane protein [Algoriphagus ratkowskyi]|uniref:TonB-dependent receptor n=2 Tax=Algoriphagus ratkowskyi TaxID=57028 RepID=A0A2W7T5I1_9BACT|nr:TonB-dependent receptor [Algoriphagus ratkowskyi]PZX58432.1 TonB-linked SusC/RagA family outer membrane protein [Algoriphagus ratkowskyi]TXD77701.1 TonB-dependent receptor [Algoriphagus ratkowskyi]